MNQRAHLKMKQLQVASTVQCDNVMLFGAVIHYLILHYSSQETSPAPCGLTWFNRAWDHAASGSFVANVRPVIGYKMPDDAILRFGHPLKARQSSLERGQPIEPV